MTYNTEAFENRVPMTLTTINVQEIHFHLGDILPGTLNYSKADNITLKVVMHYSDPYGRERTKTMTLPSTTIL